MKKVTIKETPELCLVSAEPQQQEHSPILRVLIAAAWLGVMAAVVGALPVILGAAAGRSVADQGFRMLALFAVFGAAAAVLSAIDRKNQRAFEENQKSLIDNAERFNGTVTGCEKISSKVVYANAVYDEALWRFVIEYDDGGERVTVKSGKYQNDLSDILSDTSVDVLKKSDGTYAFGEFKLKTDNEIGIKLPIAEIEE